MLTAQQRGVPLIAVLIRPCPLLLALHREAANNEDRLAPELGLGHGTPLRGKAPWVEGAPATSGQAGQPTQGR
jgi:hypothetical protein